MPALHLPAGDLEFDLIRELWERTSVTGFELNRVTSLNVRSNIVPFTGLSSFRPT